MGLPTPKSLQLCPPGPVKTTSKRRLPSARVVMWPVSAPSTTRKASIFLPAAANLQSWRMPTRLPSPSSPTLAASNNPRGKSGRAAPIFPGLRYRQKRREAGAVVGNAGSAKGAIGRNEDVVFVTRRDYGIEVRGKRDIRRLASSRQDVAGAVDGGVPAGFAELRLKPEGALLLEKGRRGDAAQGQVGFVDPLLFARKPLQTLTNRAMSRSVPPGWRQRRLRPCIRSLAAESA